MTSMKSLIRTPHWAKMSVVMLPLWGASAGHALSQYPSKLPNGEAFSCGTCHVRESGGGARNAFGQDVDAHTTGRSGAAVIRWSELWYLDSDGDGQTNGQELGDPCGDWTSGATPARTTDIANPGDDTSTSADPGVACAAPGAEEDAGPGGGGSATDAGADSDGTGTDAGAGVDGTPSSGGCSASALSTTQTPWFSLAFVAGLGLVGLRRRR